MIYAIIYVVGALLAYSLWLYYMKDCFKWYDFILALVPAIFSVFGVVVMILSINDFRQTR